MRNFLYFLLLAFPSGLFAQADDINISAAFTESIELRITTGGDISWSFTTINDYKNGFLAHKRMVEYEVASSVNFSVQCQITAMTNANGDELNLGNISLRPGVKDEYLGDRGSRWEWSEGDESAYTTNHKGVTRGDIFFGDKLTSPRTLVVPGPTGNAGDFSQNQYVFMIGMGAKGHIVDNGLPPMLDQNISPGTYTGTIILTAIPETL
ncbi:MAG: hypothetical protein AAF824_14735 [Bacteroidota bacterium]